MSYINLINQIPELDKQRLINYIDDYGINKVNFVGLDKWLQQWSHSKQKLYKLLGDKLIYKTTFEYEKNQPELKIQLDALYENSKFIDMFYADFLPAVKRELKNSNNNPLMNAASQSKQIKNVVHFLCLLNDEIDVSFKYKAENKKNTLQISKGMKPIKAIQKVLNYFDYVLDEEVHTKLMSEFEEFRLSHSRIFNNKTIKGQLCISIHPLDFITMSDNDMNWSSCMSWTEKGCYRVGTIEMMNSNNVVCCYIESDDIPYYFSKDFSLRTKEEYRWNNKKLRELAYVTKDIIMNGKSYPYINEEFNIFIINTLKELAHKNLKWDYSFGPEVYKDMDYFFSGRSMNVLRQHRANDTVKKHGILFDTKGMYNDMLNVTPSNMFKCYRNKVEKTKIISISGKANCLCCNNSIIKTYWDRHNLHNLDYNDRFHNLDSLICETCKSDFTCYFCNTLQKDKIEHKILIKSNYVPLYIDYYESESKLIKNVSICPKCFNKNIKLCPCCGNPMVLGNFFAVGSFDTNETPKDILNKNKYQSVKTFQCLTDLNYKLEALYVCENCISEVEKDLMEYNNGQHYTFKNEAQAEPFKLHNLKSCDINKFDFSKLPPITGWIKNDKI